MDRRRFRLAGWIPSVLALLAPIPRPPAAAEVAPEPRALIAQVLEAYGGRERLEAVRAYRMDGEFFNLHRHESSPTVRIFARPNRLKILIGYEGASEVRLVDGAKGWRSSGGEPLAPADGPMLDAMVLQAGRADVPWILAEHAADAKLIASLEKDGARLLGLEIAMPGGLVFRAYVHPGSHRVVVSQGELTRGEVRTLFETRYSDFRAVEGIWFAFHEENWASGVQTGVTTLKRVNLHPKLRDHEFVPPLPAGRTPATTG